MEKKRIRPVYNGNSLRISYSRQEEVLEIPNLIEVQKKSYEWFLKEGLKEAFDDICPITNFGGDMRLDFVDFTLAEDEAKHTIEECKERDLTYEAPLRVKARLYVPEKDKNGNKTGQFEIKESDIFMGNFPLMTETGTFVINGAERVIVSQLVRSPGIYYDYTHDKLGKKLFA